MVETGGPTSSPHQTYGDAGVLVEQDLQQVRGQDRGVFDLVLWLEQVGVLQVGPRRRAGQVWETEQDTRWSRHYKLISIKSMSIGMHCILSAVNIKDTDSLFYQSVIEIILLWQ